jgi:hypothetical protein
LRFSGSTIYLFYNFFNAAILGPPTLKTTYSASVAAYKKLRLCFSRREEMEPLHTEKISLEQTIADCEKLQQYCLFKPHDVSKKLSDEDYTPVGMELN